MVNDNSAALGRSHCQKSVQVRDSFAATEPMVLETINSATLT